MTDSPTPPANLAGTTDTRPWGQYTVLRDEPGYKVKEIVVNPGQRLSLQMHHHREEFWIVTQGQAAVTIGEDVRPVCVGSTVHIPKTATHRIANTGDEPVIFIEVQLGTYFGEDDIVRFADDYQRV